MNLELDGRVALVSGCSQGLGYACVRTLARHGADTVSYTHLRAHET